MTILPLSAKRRSRTTRAFGAIACSPSSARWKVVTVSPSSRFALASQKAPVQTESTTSEAAVRARTKSTMRASSSGTSPPGSTSTAEGGAVAKSCEGTSVWPIAVVTGFVVGPTVNTRKPACPKTSKGAA